jgi:hypothetical protein
MPQPARFESFSGTLKPRRPATHRRDFGRDYNRGQLADPDQVPASNFNQRQKPRKHAGFSNRSITRQNQATPELPQPLGAELPERQWSAFLPHKMQTAFQKLATSATAFPQQAGKPDTDAFRLMKSLPRRLRSLVKIHLPHNNCLLFNSDISAEHRSNAIVGCEHRPRRHRPSSSTH